MGTAYLFLILALINVETYAQQFNYADALMKSILFFEGQRSGKLDTSTLRNNWRASSGLQDGLPQVNLTGGYHDAGDNVKFSFPMSYSMTLLAWSIIRYEKQLNSTDQLKYAREALRWGTDYLLKSHTAPNVFWGQVGIGSNDHSCWQRPEDMDTLRTAFKIDTSKPGSDLAGEAAAALAAASIVFKNADPAYSTKLLTNSKQLFSFANNYRGVYSQSIADAASFYNSWSGYMDELAWSAAWLYRATNDGSYLSYLVNNDQSLRTSIQSMSEFSWDNKYAGVQVLLSLFYLTRGQTYDQRTSNFLKNVNNRAKDFACAVLPRTRTITYTPQGLVYIREVNMQYVTAISLLISIYGDYLNLAKQNLVCDGATYTAEEMFAFSKSQMDYMLGANKAKRSYMVGFGSNFPKKIHHRGASIPSIRTYPNEVTCQQGLSVWLPNSAPNPNVHVGAIVGGPDSNDNFDDNRFNYNQNEPTTYINAAAVGVLAKLAGK